jgi:hypothetical protein
VDGMLLDFSGSPRTSSAERAKETRVWRDGPLPGDRVTVKYESGQYRCLGTVLRVQPGYYDRSKLVYVIKADPPYETSTIAYDNQVELAYDNQVELL